MYTGLKGEDCLMDGRVHTMEKNRDETRIVYWISTDPKDSVRAQKKEATIRNSKDCMTNDK